MKSHKETWERIPACTRRGKDISRFCLDALHLPVKHRSVTPFPAWLRGVSRGSARRDEDATLRPCYHGRYALHQQDRHRA